MEKVAKFKVGTVVSDKMDKTVVVRIDSVKTHPIYKKKFIMSKNIKAHDEKNEYKVSDLVEISEVKPISRDKKFVVVKLHETASSKAKGAK